MGTEKPPTTSNRMEGMAIIAALRHSAGRKCVVHSDSQLWVNIITKWALRWERLDWQRPGKNKVIANLDLVKVAMKLYHRGQAKIIWVRGHNGNPGNELADEAADDARMIGLVAREFVA